MSSRTQSWGWRLFAGGALLGALGGMALVPHAWSTAAAQVAVAVCRPPEWIRTAYIGYPDFDSDSMPAAERALAAAPNDAALHLGAAALARDADSSGASDRDSPSAQAARSARPHA